MNYMGSSVRESFQANGIRLEIKCETEQLNGIQRVLEHAPNEESKLNNTNNPKTNRAERTRRRILDPDFAQPQQMCGNKK